jgi:hypothetical protein
MKTTKRMKEMKVRLYMQNKNKEANTDFISKINPKPSDNFDGTYLEYHAALKVYETIEKLAAVDHAQWHFWSQSIMRDMDELVSALNDIDNRLIEVKIGYGNSPAHTRVTNLIKKHNERDARWKKQWCAYTQLSEEVKETDRVWAKKAYNALKEKEKR